MSLLRQVLTVLVLVGFAGSTLISSSKYTHCINDGSEEIDCKQKLVIELALENAQNGTEEVIGTVEKVVDDDGNLKTLENPISIRCSVSDLRIRYALTYLRNFNYRPYEAVHFCYSIFEVCKDGDLDDDVTCGWWTDDQGQKIPYSQGFCCSCDWDEYFLKPDDMTRGNLDCTLFSGTTSSGHCLRYDTRWCAAYEVDPSYLQLYEVTCTIQTDSEMEILLVSPSQPVGATEDVQMKLLGELRTGPSVPDFSAKYLVVPISPLEDPIVLMGEPYWMLIDKYLFSLDGSVCNKVGSSFEAFRFEANSCNKFPGSCLGSQLITYLESDISQISSGSAPRYVLSAFGDIAYVPPAEAGQQYYLQYLDHERVTYLLVLSFVADNIVFVVNVSPGVIVEATIETFEAQSADGILSCLIVNTGTVNSDYYLTVTDCSNYIQEVPSQTASLAAGEQRGVFFQIRAETPIGKGYHCLLTLRSGEYEELDSVIVYFNTTSTRYDWGDQGGVGPGYDEEFQWGGLDLGTVLSCFKMCPFPLDFPCFWEHYCIVNFIVGLLVIAIILLFLGALKRFHVFGRFFGHRGVWSLLRFSKGRTEPHMNEHGEQRRLFHPLMGRGASDLMTGGFSWIRGRKRTNHDVIKELITVTSERMSEDDRDTRPLLSPEEETVQEKDPELPDTTGQFFKEYELYVIADDNDFVYVNFRVEDEWPGLENVRFDFSLLGRLSWCSDDASEIEASDSARLFVFSLEPLYSQQVYFPNFESKLVLLRKRRSISCDAFRFTFSLSQAKRLCSPEPVFPCINVHIATDE